MFADHWVIALLVGQISSLGLITIAFFQALPIMRFWSADSGSEQQIDLERKTYLISAVIRYVLIFQIIALVLLLITVNNHLPGLIKGAMCASGTLNLNDFGYPLLYLKIAAIFFYGVYLFMNYLDESEPEYPLTPHKFGLLPVIFVLLLGDVVLMLNYFGRIEPDIIATCCSISFSLSGRPGDGTLLEGQWIEMVLPLFYALGFLLILRLLINKTKAYVGLLLTILFIPVALYALKFHFVKFIYALPSHNCLFDIFWAQYHYIGYILFGCLMIALLAILLVAIYSGLKSRLREIHPHLTLRLRRVAALCIFLFMLINSAYWFYWITFRL
jgi:hypothetical protein